MAFYDVRLIGTRPLLQHRFNEESEAMLGQKTKKIMQKPKTPREEALLNSYYNADEGYHYIPHMYIFGAMATVGSDYKMRGSRKSVKWVIPAAIEVHPTEIPLLTLTGEPLRTFETDSRAVTNQKVKAKVICNRPRFDEWRVDFTLNIDETTLPIDTVHELLQDAGKKAAFGAFRPFFGKFRVTRFEENLLFKDITEEQIAAE